VFRELSAAEQRYQAVLAVIEDGVAVTAVAERYQVTGAGSGR
jgi:transposase-like protein